MNYWAIICPESDLPGLWKIWQLENVVTVGWGPEWLRDHPEATLPMGGYGWVERQIRRMNAGDCIVPFLRDHRIGRIAEVRQERIDEWRPILGDRHGRRIEVVWQTQDMPPPDKVALIPPELRRWPIRRTVAPLSTERFNDLAAVLNNPDYWQDMAVVRESDDFEEEEDGWSESDETRFALERHLEEFIEANFSRINFGRRLELYQDEENTGRQFPTAIGTIDLLAKDPDNAELVVIELKKTRSDDAVVGQVLRYMGWVREHMLEGNGAVSGIIIVPEISDRLRYALKMVPEVSVYTYSVSFGLTREN